MADVRIEGTQGSNVVADLVIERAAPPRAFDREDELVLALAAHDQRAWRQLFEEQHQRVYTYAWLRTGNRADAEDVAASVFVEAVRGIGGYRYRGTPVAAWLFRIAHNETVDLLKRRKRTQAAPLESIEPAAEPRAREEMRNGDEWRDVTDAVAALKREQQEVITLRLIEGRSVADVAEALGKSEAAVKMIQVRALQTLRRKLAE